MAYSAPTVNDLCVVYNSADSEEWKDYIIDLFSHLASTPSAPDSYRPLVVRAIPDNELLTLRGSLPPSKIVFVVLSPCHLDFLKTRGRPCDGAGGCGGNSGSLDYRRLVRTSSVDKFLLRCGVASFTELEQGKKNGGVLEQFDSWVRLDNIEGDTEKVQLQDCVNSRLLPTLKSQPPVQQPARLTPRCMSDRGIPHHHEQDQSSSGVTTKNLLRSFVRSQSVNVADALMSRKVGDDVMKTSADHDDKEEVRGGRGADGRGNRGSGDEVQVFHLIPTTVKCEEPSEVAIAFSDNCQVRGDPNCDAEEIDINTVQVFLLVDGHEQQMDVKWLNSRTLSFTVPPGRDEDEATVIVRTGDTNLGHVTLTYKAADVTSDVLQIYSRLLDAVCSNVLNRSLIGRSDLDKLLWSSIFGFVDDCPVVYNIINNCEQIPAKAFEMLFESTKSTATTTSAGCSVELPTLLHLAAKHGLVDLCKGLVDLPVSDFARRLTNVNGHRPSDLARQHGHGQLADSILLADSHGNSGCVCETKLTFDNNVEVSDDVRTKPDVEDGTAESQYLCMKRVVNNVRGSNISTSSSGIDVQEDDEPDDELPTVLPVLPPRRKNSEPFLTPPKLTSKTRRPSLDVTAMSHHSPSPHPPASAFHAGVRCVNSPSGSSVAHPLRNVKQTTPVRPLPTELNIVSGGPNGDIRPGGRLAGSSVQHRHPSPVDQESTYAVMSDLVVDPVAPSAGHSKPKPHPHPVPPAKPLPPPGAHARFRPLPLPPTTH
jgi:hypothetical protein